MKRVNVSEICEKVNKFRESNLKKTFTSSQLFDALHELGVSNNIIGYMLKLFPSEKMGVTKMYEMPKEPIYIELIKRCYNQRNEYNRNYKRNEPKVKEIVREISIEEAIARLQQTGGEFRVSRRKSFDVEAFRKDYPELYKKYVRYELL